MVNNFLKNFPGGSFNPFMHNVVNNARFLKYVWPFYNIIHETVKRTMSQEH